MKTFEETVVEALEYLRNQEEALEEKLVRTANDESDKTSAYDKGWYAGQLELARIIHRKLVV